MLKEQQEKCLNRQRSLSASIDNSTLFHSTLRNNSRKNERLLNRMTRGNLKEVKSPLRRSIIDGATLSVRRRQWPNNVTSTEHSTLFDSALRKGYTVKETEIREKVTKSKSNNASEYNQEQTRLTARRHALFCRGWYSTPSPCV